MKYENTKGFGKRRSRKDQSRVPLETSRLKQILSLMLLTVFIKNISVSVLTRTQMWSWKAPSYSPLHAWPWKSPLEPRESILSEHLSRGFGDDPVVPLGSCGSEPPGSVFELSAPVEVLLCSQVPPWVDDGPDFLWSLQDRLWDSSRPERGVEFQENIWALNWFFRKFFYEAVGATALLHQSNQVQRTF